MSTKTAKIQVSTTRRDHARKPRKEQTKTSRMIDLRYKRDRAHSSHPLTIYTHSRVPAAVVFFLSASHYRPGSRTANNNRPARSKTQRPMNTSASIGRSLTLRVSTGENGQKARQTLCAGTTSKRRCTSLDISRRTRRTSLAQYHTIAHITNE
jgi:hypothetical protein